MIEAGTGGIGHERNLTFVVTYAGGVRPQLVDLAEA